MPSIKKTQSKHCLICGVEFYPKYKSQIYCRRECQYKSMRNVDNLRICKTCGKQFYKRSDTKGLYCSQECSRADPESPQWAGAKRLHQEAVERKAIIKQQKEYNQTVDTLIRLLKKISKARQRDIDLTRVCRQCGKSFKADSYSVWYCSEQCRRKKDNRYSEKRIYRNGKPDLSITLPKLFIRDNGVCQLCGKHCDWNDYKIVNDNFITKDNYPSIDHIKPLSKGGLHSWDNVQLLCFRCNTVKRDNY